MFRKSIPAVFLFFAAACVRSAPSVEAPSPLPDTSPQLPSQIVTGRWTFLPESRPLSYLATSSTTLELSDSSHLRDSLKLEVHFTVSSRGEGPSRMASGTVDRIRLETGTRIGQSGLSDSALLPMRFSARVQNQALVIDSLNGAGASSSICTSTFPAILPLLQRNIISLPGMVSSGTTWRDSVTSATCSGSIPVMLTTISDYTVVGETASRGRPFLQVDRIERMTLAGDGAQGQHRVTIRARGSGRTRIHVDRVTGLLETSTGEQEAEVLVTASGRTRGFRQVVRERTIRATEPRDLN